MFFDEEMLLDLRLNIMNKYVDKFVITEATYMHSGAPKKLIFDINKFQKFKNKINYIVVDEPPPNLYKVDGKANIRSRDRKRKLNAYKREIFQIQKTQGALTNADPDDMIIISDLDEIPNLENVDLNKVNEKLIFFKQKFFCYKLNLIYTIMPWWGSKACKKKYLKSPQWLRSIKNKKYPLWRLDVLFSQKKYTDIHFVMDGGWHFTNVRNSDDLEKKLLNFLHHIDFEHSGLKANDLKKLIEEKRVMYNHKIDSKRDEHDKWGEGEKLQKIKFDQMPKYIIDNVEKYKYWLDT